MKLKTTITMMGLAASLAVIPAPVFAQSVTPAQVNQQNLSFLQNLHTQLKSFETQNPSHVRRGDVIITAINGTTITGTQTNKKTGSIKTYTINAGSAIVVRRFWGQSSLSQVSVGDRIRVIGTWTDSTKTGINAFLIRDMSIQERADTFEGTVTAISNNSFTFQSVARGSWTVNVSNTTKLIGKKGIAIQFANISVNDKLRIDGMLDSANKVITASVIRDQSYPAK